jgi:glycosyltransferase involved in cell wall biosynthesis
MNPLVSILIPAYNAAEWLGEAIESALAQTWQNKEIIVVDDGSVDGTHHVARRYEGPGLKVITQPNRGAASARNTALTYCQGDYIQWLDADDCLDPHKVEAQIRVATREDNRRLLFSGAWAYFMYRRQRADFSPTPLWQDLSPVEWLTCKMANNLHMQPANWLVSRELTEAAGPWDTRMVSDDDGEYFCRVIRASDGIHFVPEARSYYRLAGFQSLSYVGTSGTKIEALYLAMECHVRYLRSLEESPRTRSACLAYIRNWLPMFYPSAPELVQRLQNLAAECGGQLGPPRLRWKYEWLKYLVGWRRAQYAQVLFPKLKWSAIIAWDRAMKQRNTDARIGRSYLWMGHREKRWLWHR